MESMDSRNFKEHSRNIRSLKKPINKKKIINKGIILYHEHDFFRMQIQDR